MAYSVDYSNDWAWVDGIEVLTYTPPSGATIDARGCRATAGKTAAAGGQSYTPEFEGVQWYIWRTAAWGSVVPMVEGTLTDPANVIWVIYDVTLQSDGTQWSLLCRKAT